jgi:DNA-binding response OmpR family regulator
MRIFVLEDEVDIFNQIKLALSAIEGSEVVHERDGDRALEAIISKPFDCLILDRKVFGLDGMSVLEKARERDVQTPALMLTHFSLVADRAEGLDRGADDYLAKPFASEELVARVRALTRRAQKIAHPMIRRHGPLELATKTRLATWEERALSLTPKEFDILLCLSEHYPDIVSQEMLWRAVWPEFNFAPQVGVIQVTVSRLRKKIAAVAGENMVVVKTINLKGYTLENMA